MPKTLLTQRLQAAAAWQEALGLRKNLVLSKNGQKGASCADAKSDGCKSNKNLLEQGPVVGLVDCCCGKEQCGCSFIWHGGFGRSEDGSKITQYLLHLLSNFGQTFSKD